MLKSRIAFKILLTPTRRLNQLRLGSPYQIILRQKLRTYTTNTKNIITTSTPETNTTEDSEKSVNEKEPRICASCGIKLEETIDSPGYYVKSKAQELILELETEVNRSGHPEPIISEQGRQKINIKKIRRERALNRSRGRKTKLIKGREETELSKSREEILMEQFLELEGFPVNFYMDESIKKPLFAPNPLRCKRCVNALYHNVFDEKHQKVQTSTEVLSRIPKDARIVYVVSALDFPLSINKKVLEDRDPEKFLFVITKVDAFFDKFSSVERTGLPYFRDSLAQLFGINPDNVMVASGKFGWSAERILERLPSGSIYFVGEVNTGKSTLVNKLMHTSDKDNLKLTYGPGISYFPNFTRRHQKYVLERFGVTIVDTPGFSSENNGVFKYILPTTFKQVVETKKYANSGPRGHKAQPLKVKSQKVFNGDRVLSVGGFFYLKPPAGTVITALQAMRGEPAIYSSLEKAKDLSFVRPKEIGKRFSVNHEAIIKLKRYVIPPFYGQIDLVIRGLGFISICPTSTRNVDGLFQVYVPDGVDVMVRDTMFSYIYRTKKNKGKPDSGSKKCEIILNPVPSDKLIFTKLYEVPMDISDLKAFAVAKPRSLFKEDEKVRSKDEYKNIYWRKPDFN